MRPSTGADPTSPLAEMHLRRSISDASPKAAGTPMATYPQSPPVTASHAANSPPSFIFDPTLSPRVDSSPKATESQAVFQLINAVLGAGIVGYPFCFRNCGLLLASLLILITVFAAEFSMRLLLTSASLAGGIRSYEDLALKTYGRSGRGVLNACVVAMNLGALVAYLNLSADVLSSAAGTIIPAGVDPSRNVVLACLTICCALPIALFVRSPPVLSAVSQASVAVLLAFATTLVGLALGPGAAGLRAMDLWRPSGVLVAFPVVAYGFTAHQVLFSVVNSMKSPTLVRSTGVVNTCMTASASVYMIVGVAGYAAFGTRVQGDVLRNIGGGSAAAGVSFGSLQRLVKVGYGLSLLATIPLLLLPLQATCGPWVQACFPAGKGGNKEGRQFRENILIAAILAAACTIAIVLPNVEYVFGLAGSTASVLISFILPAAIFLKQTEGQRGSQGHSIDLVRGTPRWHRHRQLAGTLLIFGAVAAVACTGALLSSIREEAQVVKLVQELVREDNKAIEAVKVQTQVVQVAQAVGAASEAQRHLDETQGGTNQAVAAAEQLTKTASELGKGSLPKGKQQRARDARSDLKPTIAAAEALIDSLERASESLSAALADALEAERHASNSGGSSGSGSASGSGSESSLAAATLAAEESLQAARNSKIALLEVEKTLIASAKSASTDGLEAQLRDVANAAVLAEKNVDRMIEALRVLKTEQSSKLEGLVTELEAQREKAQSFSSSNKDAKQADSGEDNASKKGETQRAGAVATEAQEEVEREKEKSKETEDKTALDSAIERTEDGGTARPRVNTGDAAGTLVTEYIDKDVDVATLIKAAEEAATDTVQAAKATAEQAVESRPIDVAVRAIEIAKEMQTSGHDAGGGGGAVASADGASGAADTAKEAASAGSEADGAHGSSGDVGDVRGQGTGQGAAATLATQTGGVLDELVAVAQAADSLKTSNEAKEKEKEKASEASEGILHAPVDAPPPPPKSKGAGKLSRKIDFGNAATSD